MNDWEPGLAASPATRPLPERVRWWWFLPVFFGLALVAGFSVNLVYWDDWATIRLIRQFREQGWNWAIVWAQNNEHRILFPRLVLMGVGWWSAYDTRILSFVGQGFVFAAYGTCLRYLQAQPADGRARTGRVAAVLLVGAACYSSKQYENFLWSFQITFLMVLGAAVGAFFHLDRALRTGRRRNWLGFALAGIVASFSALHGLLVWPVAVAATLLAGFFGGRRLWPAAAGIAVLGLLVGAAYAVGYQRPAHHPGFLGSGFGPAAGYFFAASGSWASVHFPEIAVGAGMLAAGLSGGLVFHLARARRMAEAVFPLCLIGFGFAVAAMVAVGRSGMESGLATALASKYSSFTLLIYVGMVLLGYREWAAADAPAGRSPVRRAGWAVAAVLTAGMLAADAAYLYGAWQWRQARQADAEILRNYRRSVWPELRKVGPFAGPEDAEALASALEQWGWNVFAR